MHKQKFTAILIPQDEGGYQVFFPYYPIAPRTEILWKKHWLMAKTLLKGF
jgi:hypothetical protein